MKVLAWPAFKKGAANPHAALLCEQLQDLGVEVEDWSVWRACMRHADLWHLHHPDTVVYPRSVLLSVLGTLVFFLLLSLARRRKTRIVWTVHDIGNNDALHPRIEVWFWRFFVPSVDAFVCLSEGSRKLVQDRFPALRGRPSFTTGHGHYRDAYPHSVARQEARRALGLPPEATVLLHFGLMRPYKNIPPLIRTFRALPDPDAILLVAGKPFDAVVERDVQASAEGCPRVRLFLRWVPTEEVQHFFAACDLVVLPYRRILNSGAAMLALSFARPVLLPDKGSMREQQEAFGSQWVRLYSGDLTLSDLSGACRWARDTSRPTPPDFAGRDWHDLACKTRAIYRQVLSTELRS